MKMGRTGDKRDDGIMKTINRKSIMITNMNDFDYLATNDSYLEVTAYGNGEDCYDIKTDEESFSVSKGQVEAILYCIYQLNITKE